MHKTNWSIVNDEEVMATPEPRGLFGVFINYETKEVKGTGCFVHFNDDEIVIGLRWWVRVLLWLGLIGSPIVTVVNIPIGENER